MVPLQVILLLFLASTPAALPPSFRFLSTTSAVVLLLTSHLALILYVWSRARQALGALHQPTGTTAITASIDRLFSMARWATLLFLATALYHSSWPMDLRVWIGGTHLLRYVPLLAETLLILPTLFAWLAFWSASYFIESANRERSLPYRLAQDLPVHPMPTLPQFLSMQIRHNFYILAPFALHSLIIACSRLLTPYFPYAEDIAGPLGILVVLLLTPWILARVWSTVSLTGPLRARLDAVAATYRLRFRDILLWRTHNAVTNAAILGWVPFSRYFLMTDALLETLSDRQLEAVFAHEVGHGVHRHILWYLAAIVGTVSMAYGAAVFWDTYLPPHIGQFAGRDATPALISMGLLMLFMAVGFPWMSHRFEHQADYFAARHMARKFEEDPAFDPHKPIPAQLLPPEINGNAAVPLSLLTTPAEVVTLQQYLAGAYPHAAESNATPPAPPEPAPETPATASHPTPPAAAATAASAPPSQPAAPPTTTRDPVIERVKPALRSFTPAQAGAEMFISALDTILDLSHRSRDRGGWMHPSPHRRIALLRQLASQPLTARAFNVRMVQTRLAIALLFTAGLTAGTAGAVLENRARAQAQAATSPATAPTTTPALPMTAPHRAQ